jgi:class 3 adenylate cyclase
MMDARPRPYDVASSDARIVDILDNSAVFEEGSIPSSTALTYQNGYYVECTAIFIDIRDSTKLRERHTQRRTLGKLYRAYVSECVAVLNGNPCCKQVFIQGDCVSAVFDTPTKQAVNDVFRLVAALNSVVRLMNYRLQRRGLTPIKVGIGIDTGRALMIRAGFTGSGISDIVWMGDVLNQASHLCNMANKEGRKVIMLSAAVIALLDQPALSVDGKGFVDSCSGASLLHPSCWHCDVVNVGIEWHLQDAIRQHEASQRLANPPGFLERLFENIVPPSPPPPAPALPGDLLQAPLGRL